MTIAIAGNFTEGVVFGADSAVTYKISSGTSQNSSYEQVYEGAQKIYHLGAEEDWSDSNYGAMVYGSASFAGQSWRNIFANFSRGKGFSRTRSAGKIADSFIKHLNSLEPDSKKRNDAGVFIAGFGKSDEVVKCFNINAKALNKSEVRMKDINYDGMPHVVQRLLKGIDTQTAQKLEQQFKGSTIELDQNGNVSDVPLYDFVLDSIMEYSPKCNIDVDMPLRDALDYVHFLCYSTIKHFKFQHGAPVCGGEIELVVITLDRGFRRITTKPLDSQLI